MHSNKYNQAYYWLSSSWDIPHKFWKSDVKIQNFPSVNSINTPLRASRLIKHCLSLKLTRKGYEGCLQLLRLTIMTHVETLICANTFL